MSTDVRWYQRLSNYQKAITQLTEFIHKGELNKFEVQGLIQCFEYTFELAWKTTKDYLQEQGFDVKTPRAAIQTAFQIELIEDGHIFIDALEKRNLMSHTYDEEVVKVVETLVRNDYYPALMKLYQSLEALA